MVQSILIRFIAFVFCLASMDSVYAQTVGFNQLYIGLNGPGNPNSSVFRSRDELFSSWLASSMTTIELEHLAKKIDFKSNSLVAISVGKMANFSGSIIVDKLEIGGSVMSVIGPIAAGPGQLVSYSRVGFSADCENSTIEVQPFVLLITDVMSSDVIPGSYFQSNFYDACREFNGGFSARK